jgi:PAS domain S-box-containing protein
VEALQRSEQRYRSLVDATTAVVWRASASGEVSSPMPSWCAFTGQQQEDCQGWGWLEVVHPDDRETTAQAWREAVRNRHVYELEHRLRRHDGTYRIMAVRGAPVTGEGGDIIEWVGTHTDITDQRRAEDERRKFELEKVVANQVTNERRRIARDLHDGIRQQLVGIKMLSGNLYKKLLAKEAPEAQLVLEFSNLISDANLEVRQLINGLVPAEIDKDSLPQALRRAAANIEQWYGVSCIVTSDEQVVLSDAYTANHLLHLASEAMTNAARHARATQINVSLTLTEGSLRLEVHDDGIGVPEQFDKIGGTGISSMRNRAELIGARFGIESREGRGTKVACTLRDVTTPTTQAHLETSSPVTPRFGP